VQIKLRQCLAHLGSVPMEIRQQPAYKLLVRATNAWTPDLHGPDARRKTASFSVPISISDRITGLAALTLASSRQLFDFLLQDILNDDCARSRTKDTRSAKAIADVSEVPLIMRCRPF